MFAIRVHHYAEPDGIQIEETETPAPKVDEILVHVAAASINPVDWKVADGLLRARLPLDLPYIPGGDFAGTVASVGSQVTSFKPGDAVFGMTSTPGYARGAYAEFVAVKAMHVAKAPASLSLTESAAVPLASLTAWQAVHDLAGLRPGQTVLVHAAAGGVGSFAVQFARLAGAEEIIATCSAVNADYVRSLGATRIIDYRAEAFEGAVGGLDIVIDLLGGDVQARSYGVLRPGGTLVNAWGTIMQDKADAAGVRGVKVAVSPDGAQLAEIARLIDAGEVELEISKTFQKTEVKAAFALNRAGHTRGKIVLSLSG